MKSTNDDSAIEQIIDFFDLTEDALLSLANKEKSSIFNPQVLLKLWNYTSDGRNPTDIPKVIKEKSLSILVNLEQEQLEKLVNVILSSNKAKKFITGSDSMTVEDLRQKLNEFMPKYVSYLKTLKETNPDLFEELQSYATSLTNKNQSKPNLSKELRTKLLLHSFSNQNNLKQSLELISSFSSLAANTIVFNKVNSKFLKTGFGQAFKTEARNKTSRLIWNLGNLANGLLKHQASIENSVTRLSRLLSDISITSTESKSNNKSMLIEIAKEIKTLADDSAIKDFSHRFLDDYKQEIITFLDNKFLPHKKEQLALKNKLSTSDKILLKLDGKAVFNIIQKMQSNEGFNSFIKLLEKPSFVNAVYAAAKTRNLKLAFSIAFKIAYKSKEFHIIKEHAQRNAESALDSKRKVSTEKALGESLDDRMYEFLKEQHTDSVNGAATNRGKDSSSDKKVNSESLVKKLQSKNTLSTQSNERTLVNAHIMSDSVIRRYM